MNQQTATQQNVAAMQFSSQQEQYPAASRQQDVAAPTDAELQGLLFNDRAMDQLLKLANIMAAGKTTVPQHLRGNAGDCMAVIMQAAQWKMNPFAVAQKTHLVHGTLGYEAQLVNAVITSMAPTDGRLEFEWFGDWSKVIGKFKTKTSDKGSYQVPGWNAADEAGLGVRVWATLKGEDQPRVLELLLSQATVRNSTLWASDPKQQLAYLAIKRWSRLYCPDVILGVYTPDELAETNAARERDVTPKQQNDQPKDTKNRARSKLAQRRAQIDDAEDAQEVSGDPVTLAQVTDAINKAQTPEDLKAVKEMAAGLPEEHKAEAIEAFNYRKNLLKQQAEQDQQ